MGGCAAGPRRSPDAPVHDEIPPSIATTDAAVFVDAATAMVGQPYRWGGSAPGGFDCSGLVAYAAAAANIPVPRTAHDQLKFGTPTPRTAIDKGDLVFMRIAHKELHVGIAIDRTHFVHAPSTGRFVRIDSLDALPYQLSFIAARRILGSRRSAASTPQPGARATEDSGG